ncbi:hypothetical protein LINGRAHAP2_LOCUS4661 [Linum grandiflorum]
MLISFLWWRIWKSHNDVVFNRLQWMIPGIVSKTKQELADFLSTWHHSSSPPPRPGPAVQPIPTASWAPPPFGWIKINTDASFFSKSNTGAVAWVVKDARGILLHSGTSFYAGLSNVGTLETLGVRDAVLWARSMQFQLVIFENDNQVVIHHLHSKNSDHPLYGTIL